MLKVCKVKICSASEAKMRAKVYGREKWLYHDMIYGIDEEIFDELSKKSFEIQSSSGESVFILPDGDDMKTGWYVPKLFIDIEEII